ncbi:hydroxyethylthiazole kinase [uncultured Bartonella sp.]|uniref:hydroxyethylthiazole kinase n=1 Tax=uncultured Bartonella sp. TaxID=104108 RepID=UPI00262D6EF2|nr:hydroxyethylthiazole kinase [uncultured Bartonella sp.]
MFPNLDSRIGISNLRETRPLVQCLTNDVAMNFCANVVTALGASPVMAFAPEEAGDFVASANAVTTNIGTLTNERYSGICLAMTRAKELGKPVVFDPVAHFVTPFRQSACHHLLALNPSIIRGNASEIVAFSNKTNANGVDSCNEGEQRFSAAVKLSQRTKAIVAMSGETDFITDGKNHWLITGGDALMSKVSATGCALTCVTGAFAALAPDRLLETTIAAFATFSAAGKIAAASAKGPGSFVPLFLDALSTIDEQCVAETVKVVSWH